MTTPNPADPADPQAAARRIVELDKRATPAPWTWEEPKGGVYLEGGTEEVLRVHDHPDGLRELHQDVMRAENAENLTFIEEVRTLAPILARAYLDSNPPLVWRSKDELHELPGGLFQWKQGEDYGATLGWELNMWETSEPIWIACLASNGEPWPVRLAEVGG